MIKKHIIILKYKFIKMVIFNIEIPHGLQVIKVR